MKLKVLGKVNRWQGFSAASQTIICHACMEPKTVAMYQIGDMRMPLHLCRACLEDGVRAINRAIESDLPGARVGVQGISQKIDAIQITAQRILDKLNFLVSDRGKGE